MNCCLNGRDRKVFKNCLALELFLHSWWSLFSLDKEVITMLFSPWRQKHKTPFFRLLNLCCNPSKCSKMVLFFVYPAGIMPCESIVFLHHIYIYISYYCCILVNAKVWFEPFITLHLPLFPLPLLLLLLLLFRELRLACQPAVECPPLPTPPPFLPRRLAPCRHPWKTASSLLQAKSPCPLHPVSPKFFFFPEKWHWFSRP